MTTLQLETYEATHTLDKDRSFKHCGIASEIVARVHHFKKALKEFSWLDPNELICIKVDTKYPKLQFTYERETH